MTPPAPILDSTALHELRGRLAAVRRRQRGVMLATAVAAAVVVTAGWLAVTCVVDYRLDFPRWLRVLGMLAGLGGAAAAAWLGGLRVWRRKLDEDALALMVERAKPELRSRLIAALQLGRAGDRSGFVRALVAEATETVRGTDLRGVVELRRPVRWWAGAALALAGAAALAWWGAEKTGPLVRRAFAADELVPRKTRLVKLPGDFLAATGDDVTLEVSANGVLPPSGVVEIVEAGGRRRAVPLKAVEVPGVFRCTLAKVQESFEYRIALGDARGERQRVRVRPRPLVASVECTQLFPAYTALEPRKRALGELRVLAGSRLALRVRASGPLKSAVARLVNADGSKVIAETRLKPEPDPKAPAAKAATVFSAEVPVMSAEATGLTFALEDAEGLTSRGLAIYRLEVVPDVPPKIAVTWPERREELATEKATVLLAFRAEDDFGLGAVRLHYAVDWVEGAAVRTLPLDLGGGRPADLLRRFEWKLTRLPVPVREGQTVDYWFEAVDANDVTGPGSTRTDHFQIRIVNESDKRADLAARLSDAVEGLNQVRAGTEEANARLGELIMAVPAP